jgi:hypothetical protein
VRLQLIDPEFGKAAIRFAVALGNAAGANAPPITGRALPALREMAYQFWPKAEVDGIGEKEWRTAALIVRKWLLRVAWDLGRAPRPSTGAEQDLGGPRPTLPRGRAQMARLMSYRGKDRATEIDHQLRRLRARLLFRPAGPAICVEPSSPAVLAALAVSLFRDRRASYQGSGKSRYSYRSRFGVCGLKTCKRFFWRTGRGPTRPRYCMEEHGNATRVARSLEKSPRPSRGKLR